MGARGVGRVGQRLGRYRDFVRRWRFAGGNDVMIASDMDMRPAMAVWQLGTIKVQSRSQGEICSSMVLLHIKTAPLLEHSNDSTALVDRDICIDPSQSSGNSATLCI